MRTIIINTLGEEVPQHELLFLPFREDQLVWLNTNMGGIGACAEKIENLYNAQDKRQDYRLMVLADLGGYEDIDREEIRTCYRSILNAYINLALFQPLAEGKKIPPKSVSVVYMITRILKGTGKIAGGRHYDYVLKFPEDRPFDALELVRLNEVGREEHLDVTAVFRTLIQASKVCRDCGDPEKHRSNLNHFRNNLSQTLETMQKCRYTPSGSMQSEVIPIRAEEFFPKCTDPDLIWLDLQLNLSDMLARQSRVRRERLAELKLTAHTEEELAFRFRRGLRRVHTLLHDAPEQTYFPLENKSDFSVRNLDNRIWTALTEKQGLIPGVMEADAHRKGQELPQKDGLATKVRKAWIRMDQEKKRFDSLYDQLQQEYDPQVARQQQEKILDVCAGEFRRWRSEMLAAKLVRPEESKAVAGVIPELDTKALEAELHQAQVKCSAMAADKLEDYLDLRQEAEEVRADFRSSAKIWMPDSGNSNSRFFITYSVTLAALFLVQMLLPYVGITLGQKGVEISRYVHFIASTALFVALYMVGVLIWLRQMCRELSGHSLRMAELIRRSSERRRKSVEKIVRSFGEDLPQCAILHGNLRQLRMLHGLNAERYTRYRTHMELLTRAEELLQELETELQLPSPAMDRVYKPEQVTKGIDYQKSANHVSNIPYYMLLSDEWGDGVC